MKLATALFAFLGLSIGAAIAAIAAAPLAPTANQPVIQAQEDCGEGETWNEELQVCEKTAD